MLSQSKPRSLFVEFIQSDHPLLGKCFETAKEAMTALSIDRFAEGFHQMKVDEFPIPRFEFIRDSSLRLYRESQLDLTEHKADAPLFLDTPSTLKVNQFVNALIDIARCELLDAKGNLRPEIINAFKLKKFNYVGNEKKFRNAFIKGYVKLIRQFVIKDIKHQTEYSKWKEQEQDKNTIKKLRDQALREKKPILASKLNEFFSSADLIQHCVDREFTNYLDKPGLVDQIVEDVVLFPTRKANLLMQINELSTDVLNLAMQLNQQCGKAYHHGMREQITLLRNEISKLEENQLMDLATLAGIRQRMAVLTAKAEKDYGYAWWPSTVLGSPAQTVQNKLGSIFNTAIVIFTRMGLTASVSRETSLESVSDPIPVTSTAGVARKLSESRISTPSPTSSDSPEPPSPVSSPLSSSSSDDDISLTGSRSEPVSPVTVAAVVRSPAVLLAAPAATRPRSIAATAAPLKPLGLSRVSITQN